MTDAKLVDPGLYDFSKLTEHMTNEQRILATLERIEGLLKTLIEVQASVPQITVETPAVSKSFVKGRR